MYMGLRSNLKKKIAAKQVEADQSLLEEPTIDGNALLAQLQAAKSRPLVTTTIDGQEVNGANLGAIELAKQTALDAQKKQGLLNYMREQAELEASGGLSGFGPMKSDEELRLDAARKAALKNIKMGAQ